jgi:hypothetical protein
VIERDPGFRDRVGGRLGPEPLAAVLTVCGLILFVVVLAVLVLETH